MTLDRLTVPGSPRFDGRHHCTRCGDNVRHLTPIGLCDFCAAHPTRVPPPSADLPKENAVMTEQPDPTIGETVILPVYCVEVAELLADTEAHPDPAVRAVRKIVTQAALALRAVYDQTSGSEAPSALPAPSASSEPEPASTPARREPKDSQLTLRQRLLILGVDQAAVRAWAAENGISYNRQGPIRLDVLDAYEEAHPVAA